MIRKKSEFKPKSGWFLSLFAFPFFCFVNNKKNAWLASGCLASMSSSTFNYMTLGKWLHLSGIWFSLPHIKVKVDNVQNCFQLSLVCDLHGSREPRRLSLSHSGVLLRKQRHGKVSLWEAWQKNLENVGQGSATVDGKQMVVYLSLLSEKYFKSLSPWVSGCCSPTQIIDTLKLGKLSSLLLSEPHDHSSEGRDDHWWLALVDMWGLENSEFKMLISVAFTKSL